MALSKFLNTVNALSNSVSTVTNLVNNVSNTVNALRSGDWNSLVNGLSGTDEERLSEPAQQETSIWDNSSITQSIIRVETVNTINGIPPIPDNIVDPPAFYDTSCFEQGKVTLSSWDTTVNKIGPFIGRDYFDRVMTRGSMLFVLPIELTTPIGKLASNAIVGEGSGEAQYAFGSASYGYEVKFQTRRYTETVLMHFFMAASAMGLDFTQADVISRAKQCLPDHMYKTITGNTIDEQTLTSSYIPQMGGMWETAKKIGISGAAGVVGAIGGGLLTGGLGAITGAAVASGGAWALLSGDDEASTDEELAEAANKSKAQFDLYQEQIAQKESQLDTYMNSGNESMTTVLSTQIENLKDKQLSVVTGSGGLLDSCYPSLSSTDRQTAIDKLTAAASAGSLSSAVETLFGGSIVSSTNAEKDLLLHYVGGFTPSLMKQFGLEAKNRLNFTVFNLNGPPSRNMVFSNSTGESAIAKLSGRASLAKVADATKDQIQASSQFMQNLSGSISGIGGKFINSMTDGIDVNGIVDDMYLHNPSMGAGYLIGITGMYDRMMMPQVYNSSSFSPTYHVDIREVCISSDKYSLLRIFWTISHLIPYAIPMQSSGLGIFGISPTITPRAPMYAMAYVKGVMNLPRCVISNLSLEFDPKFQTIEGVPTEVSISMDMTSFISLATTPLLGTLWSTSWSDGYSDDNWTVITQMFNPTSSINIIATMCGFNTVFTQPTMSIGNVVVGLLFGKIVKGIRAVKNTYANIKKGYIGSMAQDRVFGTDSNFKVGVLTGS
jgi:hypothetical protein